jgi:hypothetical protein
MNVSIWLLRKAAILLPYPICHNNNYITINRRPNDHSGGSQGGSNPQVIHSVDKKVSYWRRSPGQAGVNCLRSR